MCSKVINRTNIYLVKFHNRNTRKRCEIYSKLTIKIPQRRHLSRSSAFIVRSFLTLKMHFATEFVANTTCLKSSVETEQCAKSI